MHLPALVLAYQSVCRCPSLNSIALDTARPDLSGRLHSSYDTAAEAKKLCLPRWMRKGLPSKLTDEDKDYEIKSVAL